MLIPMVEMLKKDIHSLCNVSVLKIVKIEATNKVIFYKEMPSMSEKASLFISLLNWKPVLEHYIMLNRGYFCEQYMLLKILLGAVPSVEEVVIVVGDEP